MELTLQQHGKAAHFTATSPTGHTNSIHATLFDGEARQAQSPMEALLMAVAGCTSADIVLILTKMQQYPDDINIKIKGTRQEIGKAKPFRAIHLDYFFKGTLDANKVKKSVELSVEKYCSVIESLHPDCKISYQYFIES